MQRIDLKTRLEGIKDKMKTQKFIEGKGMGNEISFYIFDYDPKQELYVREQVKYIIKEFNRVPSNEKVIEIDIYKMFIDLLKKEGDFEKVIVLEEKNGRDYILDAITTYITPEVYAESIQGMTDGFNIIFLTGVGKVYPYMRAHNILNSLQQSLEKKKKLVMFYPGTYSGQDLKLFDKFDDENYYRAFPLI